MPLVLEQVLQLRDGHREVLLGDSRHLRHRQPEEHVTLAVLPGSGLEEPRHPLGPLRVGERDEPVDGLTHRDRVPTTTVASDSSSHTVRAASPAAVNASSAAAACASLVSTSR